MRAPFFCDHGRRTGRDGCGGQSTVPSGYYKCCYSYQKLKKKGYLSEEYKCVPIDEKTYNDIKKFIEDGEKAAKDQGYDEVTGKIDCSSNYIIYSLVSLILLFL